MPGTFAPIKSHELECSILHDVTDVGPVIGFYAGKTIAEQVVDVFGNSYVFCGIASRARNGKFDVADLRAGEHPGSSTAAMFLASVGGNRLLE